MQRAAFLCCLITQKTDKMRSLTKVLLAAVLLTSASYAIADKSTNAVKVSNGNVVEDRHLSGFHSIDAAGSFDVYITQGGTESVKVDAPADMQDRIITEVEGGTLRVHDKHGSWSWGWGGGKKVAVYVTINEVNSIGITGSGNVYFRDGIRSSNLRLWVSGSGDVDGRVDAKSLQCDISGSGDMKLNGHAETSSISVSGSGDYTARDLVTVNTSVHVSGSGDASINVSNSLDASVSGSGDVSYSGGPKHIMKSKSGSGDIDGH
jgi:hypothetical protein